MKQFLSGALAVVMCTPAFGAWTLDGDQSAVSFVSTKAINVAEVHRFGELSGSVDDAGMVGVSISLSSVDTGIELRDERMREMLFDTARYATAEVTAEVDVDAIRDLSAGQSIDLTIEGRVDLHGQSQPLTMEVVVTRSGEYRLLVVSKKPVIINAPQFALSEGVEALREIAGLPSISLAVPVSFVLAFDGQ